MKFTFATLSFFISVALAAPRPAGFNKLRRATTEDVNPKSYIVKLKDNASKDASIQSLNDLVFAFDDNDSYKEVTYSDWTIINGYAAKLGGAALTAVRDDPNVEYVEEDGIVDINYTVEKRNAEPEPEPEVAAREWIPELEKRAAGAGTNFYGVDTGIFIEHTAFTGRAQWLATFGGYPDADGNGHGTHTAGTAAGKEFGPASSASIFAIKVLSDKGRGQFSDIISGVNAAVNHAVASGKPSVVNLSLGGTASSAIDDAVASGVRSGVHFTVAAGNDNKDASGDSPARVASANTVGAIDRSKVKADFSNFGKPVDVWFLGVDVTSAWIGSDIDTNTISGTSMAAPGVAGILLTHLGNNGQSTPTALSSALVAAAANDVIGAPSSTTKKRAVPF